MVGQPGPALGPISARPGRETNPCSPLPVPLPPTSPKIIRDSHVPVTRRRERDRVYRPMRGTQTDGQFARPPARSRDCLPPPAVARQTLRAALQVRARRDERRKREPKPMSRAEPVVSRLPAGALYTVRAITDQITSCFRAYVFHTTRRPCSDVLVFV